MRRDARGGNDRRNERRPVRGTGDVAVPEPRRTPAFAEQPCGVARRDRLARGRWIAAERREVLTADHRDRRVGSKDAAIVGGVQLATEPRVPSLQEWRKRRGRALQNLQVAAGAKLRDGQRV